MTKKPGQNGPEASEMRDTMPASADDSMAGTKTPPLFLTDPLVDRKPVVSEDGHAPAPDVVGDGSILPELARDIDHETALPVVQEDRSAPFQELVPNGDERFEGIAVIGDTSVPTEVGREISDISAPSVLEDSLTPFRPHGNDLESQRDASTSEENTQAQEIDESNEPYVNPRPLPAAIDLSGLAADRPKGFFAKVFGRKKPAKNAPSRTEPVVVAQMQDASPDPFPEAVQYAEETGPVWDTAETDKPHAETAQDKEGLTGPEGHDDPSADITEADPPASEPASVSFAHAAEAEAGKNPGKISWFSKSGKDGDRGNSGRKKVRKTPSSGRGNPPIQVIIGWIAESNRKDVIEHARGFAADHIETLASAWISVSPFRDGHIFEVHEGGSGLSYMPDVIEQLTRDPDQVVWVPSGTVLNRVLTIRIAEDHVFSTILTEAESALVRSSGQEPLQRTGRMVRLVPKGTGALATGIALAAVGALTLMGAGYYSSLINQQPLPSRTFNPENMPHNQIIRLSEGIREDRWVSRIVFEDGQWRADFETVQEVVLPVDDAGAQAVIDDLYNEEERIKKAVEDSIAKETAE